MPQLRSTWCAGEHLECGGLLEHLLTTTVHTRERQCRKAGTPLAQEGRNLSSHEAHMAGPRWERRVWEWKLQWEAMTELIFPSFLSPGL